MSAQNTIALIFDCDDTLCEDSTTFLLTKLRIDADTFWRSVNLMVRKGWDPQLATMRKLLRIVNGEKIRLTNQKLRETGARIDFFPGIPGIFEELKEYLNELEEAEDQGMTIEYYVVSSGFEEIIRGSIIASHMTDIFGCTFDVNPQTGIIRFPKSVVSFTEKTKFIFAINKGISGLKLKKSPYDVNKVVEEEQRRIPFHNMTYIGDGPSDIPCFSLLLKNKGYAIGVYGKKSVKKAWQLARGRRMTVGPYPRDYSKGQPLRTMIERTVKEIVLDIVRRKEIREVAAPRY
jgi:hypothetical protein